MIACAVCALPLKCVISATHIRFIRTTFANTAIITGQAIRPENVLNAVLVMFIRTAIAFTATPALALSVRNAVTAGHHFDRRMESALIVSATYAERLTGSEKAMAGSASNAYMIVPPNVKAVAYLCPTRVV